MKSILNNIYVFLSKEDKNNYILIIFILILFSLFEIISIASLGFLLKISTDVNIIYEENLFKKIFIFLDFKNINYFIVFFALISIFTFIFSAILSTISNWKLVNYMHSVGAKMSNRLFEFYLNKDRAFHLTQNKSLIIKKINTDIEIVISQIFLPSLLIFSRLVHVLIVFLFLSFVNLSITILLILFFLLYYFLFYQLVKKKLENNSFEINKLLKHKSQILIESFSGIKEIIFYNTQDFFINQFSAVNKSFHNKAASTTVISHSPRALLELLSIIIIVITFIISLKIFNNNLSQIISLLAVFALAGLRTIPGIQLIFQNFGILKGAMNTFVQIKDDIKLSNIEYEEKKKFNTYNLENDLTFKNNICLKNITFSYPSSEKNSLNNLTLSVEKNKLVSIIGPNGSGKSTIVNIILGLIYSNKGSFLIDNKILHKEQIKNWKNNIGYVPQEVYLFDDTIFNNIFFGIKNVDLYKKYLDEVLRISNLLDLIKNLPLGLNTRVGDHGNNLSGGQKQKIAIARALIRQPELIIFDEATSALDKQSQLSLNDTIAKLKGNKTIIIVTHNIESLANSDLIYYIEKGEVVLSGTYEDTKSMILKKLINKKVI